MPVVNGRLKCCSCGSDLGDADDPYRDPACGVCLDRENEADAEADGLAEVRCDYPPHHSAGDCGCFPDLAECGVCGYNKQVCCDEGYTDNEDGSTTHVGAVCVDCCTHGTSGVWDGKSVAGGTYERCD